MQFFLSALILTSSCLARGENLPSSFNITCGDITHKTPYDPNDEMGTMLNVILKGQASQIPDNELTGYYSGGVGYKINAMIQEPIILGTSAMLSVNLQCYARKSTEDLLSCSSDLMSLPFLPEFNSLGAKLPMPSSIAFRAQTQSSFYVRLAKKIKSSDQVGTQYYKSVREMTCVISN